VERGTRVVMVMDGLSSNDLDLLCGFCHGDGWRCAFAPRMTVGALFAIRVFIWDEQSDDGGVVTRSNPL
jgi:hypothetical protein